MAKKRLIFTLLYDRGYFMLSRNFRLQRVGNLEWLIKNYDFARTTAQIDELVILNVERNMTSQVDFVDHLRQLCDVCFVPITAGGGIREEADASLLLSNGADKVLINTLALQQERELHKIVEKYGQQSVVLGVDLKCVEESFRVYTNAGTEEVRQPYAEHLAYLNGLPVGEWLMTSIDRDGTGQGFDRRLLDLLPRNFNKPLILAGGAGKPEHFPEILWDPRVSGLATAHLFNFVGDGLKLVRQALQHSGHALPSWNSDEMLELRVKAVESSCSLDP